MPTDTAADLVDALKARGFQQDPKYPHFWEYPGGKFDVHIMRNVVTARGFRGGDSFSVECDCCSSSLILAAIDAALAQQDQTRTDATP